MTGWLSAARVYADRRMAVIVVLGFSSGLPLLLVFSTLSLWLKAEGVSLTAIGLFSLVRTPYTFKFLWAPLIDRVPLPGLTRLLGRRRGWTLFAQAALMAAILGLSATHPATNPLATALLALVVAFCSASQDIVIDAYRVEILEDREQGAGAGAIVLGYRMGTLASGAGALWLASVLPWAQVYAVMGALVMVGMAAVLLAREPETADAVHAADADEAAVARRLGTNVSGWLARPLAWLCEAAVAPLADFAARPAWAAILLFIMLYKLGDAYLGLMANPFYVEMGFSTVEIANVSKLFGMGATIAGGLLGGILVSRAGIMRALLVAGVLQMLSNLVFAAQAMVGHDVAMLTVTVATENVTGGMATAAFVAYLSSLCHAAYTATQYALLSSFMAFARDVLSASSGWVADSVGWIPFFAVSTAVALPGLAVLVWLMRANRAPPPVPQPPAP